MSYIQIYKDVDLNNELKLGDLETLNKMPNITAGPDNTRNIGPLGQYGSEVQTLRNVVIETTPIIPEPTSRLPLLLLLPLAAGLCLIVGGILKVYRKRRRPPTTSLQHEMRQRTCPPPPKKDMFARWLSLWLVLSFIASLIDRTIGIDCPGKTPCCFIDPIVTSHLHSVVHTKKIKVKVKTRKKGMWWKKHTVYHRGYARVYQQKTYETYSERCPTRLQHCCEGIQVVPNNKPTPSSP